MKKVEKPLDWPINEKEAKLENIYIALYKFTNNPTVQNKSHLIDIITQNELNQVERTGLYHFTEYEIAMINQLWLQSKNSNISSLAIFLYKYIYESAREQNMIYKMNLGLCDSPNIELFNYLVMPLKLFYNCYQSFNFDKQHSFANTILEIIKSLNDNSQIDKNMLTTAYISMLNELSCFISVNTFSILNFNRKEIKDLFKMAATLANQCGQKANESPLKGTLMITISNWILKSRNNYNHDYMYKCMPDDATKNAVANNELWMRNIIDLNDDREGHILKDIYKDQSWLKYDWAQDINFELQRIYYVTSFTKAKPDNKMLNEYGKNIFGYKTDKIAESIVPIHKKMKFVRLGYVSFFDIIYDTNEIKNEINYLCDIINFFYMSVDDKHNFLNEILQYWIYSVKDKKWENERERRYQLFIYPHYTYEGMKISDKFLKVDTSIISNADFINKENIEYDLLKKIRKEIFLSQTHNCMFCENCLQIDYDNYFSETNVCKICGSKIKKR